MPTVPKPKKKSQSAETERTADDTNLLEILQCTWQHSKSLQDVGFLRSHNDHFNVATIFDRIVVPVCIVHGFADLGQFRRDDLAQIAECK